MRRVLHLLAGVVAFAIAGVALADTAMLSWINATQNTDNTAIPATGPGSLTRTTINYGTCNPTKTGITGTVGTMFVAPPATSLSVAMVVVQEYCFNGFHTNTFGSNSALTAVVTKVNPPPTPLPPGGLTVQGTPVAYTIFTTDGALVFAYIGHAKPGAGCLNDWTVNGLQRIEVTDVDLAPDVEPVVAFTQCSAS